jgi:hypothetical protein
MLVLNGSVNVMTNGEESSTLKTGKWLRQGNPLSPLNLVGDVLNEMIKKAAGKKACDRVVGELCTRGYISSSIC